jgi:uncharacterized protein YjbI with pentapeptide repeats
MIKRIDEWLKKIEGNQRIKGLGAFIKQSSLTLKVILTLLVTFLGIFIYHSVLYGYKHFLNFVFEAGQGNDLNIGVIGDSLAVLSFIALIISLVLTARELQLSRREMAQNREATEERNRIEAEHEVLANIRALAENIDDSMSGVDEWKSEARNLIIGFNLSRLIEHSLEILVKITREEKDANSRLAEFAKEVIDKNKPMLNGLNFRGKNFFKADFSGAVISFTNLSKSNLMNSDLSNAALIKADLSNTNMKGANLEYSRLIGADLKRAELNFAKLHGADLRDAYLGGADLRRAKGLKPEQVKEALNWEEAIYNEDFRKELGLPPSEDSNGGD